MITQRNELLEIVEKNGWNPTCLDNYEFRDLATEIWLLESVWTPIGAKAYVSFLIDPMLGFQNPIAWAIDVRKNKPEDLLGGDFVVSLNQWKDEKDKVVEFLAKLRTT